MVCDDPEGQDEGWGGREETYIHTVTTDLRCGTAETSTTL